MAERMSLLDRLAYTQMVQHLAESDWRVRNVAKGVRQDGRTALADMLDSALVDIRAAQFDLENLLTPLPAAASPHQEKP